MLALRARPAIEIVGAGRHAIRAAGVAADGHPARAGVASVDLAGCRVLHRGAGGSAGPLQQRAIFNSDQRSQFTTTAFTAVLLREKIAMSMDREGRWRNNVFVERIWSSAKYEEVYPNAYASVTEARADIVRDPGSTTRYGRTSALGGRTPDQLYFDRPLLAAA
jgi:transposase InsO family protein